MMYGVKIRRTTVKLAWFAAAVKDQGKGLIR
jgi:hypothetical protein